MVDLVVCEAKDLQATFCEDPITLGVVFLLLPLVVNRTVHLDDDSGAVAVEVYNEYER